MQFTDPIRRRRKPSLTPMIDVVFLLLVFFMLASRFGFYQVMPMPLASGGGDFSGPPRLIDVLPDTVRLNGIEQPVSGVIASLGELLKTPSDSIILRAREGADVQRLVTITGALRRAGFTSLVLVE